MIQYLGIAGEEQMVLSSIAYHCPRFHVYVESRAAGGLESASFLYL